MPTLQKYAIEHRPINALTEKLESEPDRRLMI
jgi:hypothetical protein